MALLKYAVGIDVSKDALHCCFGSIDSQQVVLTGKPKRFPNSAAGFLQLLQWAQPLCQNSALECWFFMEATGVYYEQLAFFLSQNDQRVCVALPTAVRDFARSTTIKTKTDAVDATMLTRMALERKLEAWTLPSPFMRQIKHLIRERQALVEQNTVLANRLHALEHSYQPLKKTIQRLKQQRALLNKQITQIEKELAGLLENDPALKVRIENVATIQGVGTLTILTVLAETNGFVLVSSVKQLVSYAGLDIVENQSGQAHSPAHISKKGNARLRRALYLPTMAAVRFNPHLKAFYLRLLAKNGGKKKSALIAVARKLLRLIYTLFRNNSIYSPIPIASDIGTTITTNMSAESPLFA